MWWRCGGLVQQADAEAELCKPWLLRHMRDALERDIYCAHASLQAMVAAHPGQAQLPHVMQSEYLGLLSGSWGVQRWLACHAARHTDMPVPRAECASCGKHAMQLMKCAACKVSEMRWQALASHSERHSALRPPRPPPPAGGRLLLQAVPGGALEGGRAQSGVQIRGH